MKGLFRQGKEDKDREETFPASVADVRLAGREHRELNAAIQTVASQRVVLDLDQEQDQHTLDHDPANSVLPPHWLPRAWPEPSSRSRSQPEDTAA